MLLILFFLLIVIAIVSLKIRINFKDIQISNTNEYGERVKLKHHYRIELELFIFKIIKIAKIKFDNKKITRALNKAKYRIEGFGIEREIKKEIRNRKKIFTAFRNLKLNLIELNLNLKLGTEGLVTTIGIFTIISTIVPIIIRNNASKVEYSISPIYNMGNVINLWANGITEVYLVHIIHALYTIQK